MTYYLLTEPSNQVRVLDDEGVQDWLFDWFAHAESAPDGESFHIRKADYMAPEKRAAIVERHRKTHDVVTLMFAGLPVGAIDVKT